MLDKKKCHFLSVDIDLVKDKSNKTAILTNTQGARIKNPEVRIYAY
jgi:hypothetical protein